MKRHSLILLYPYSSLPSPRETAGKRGEKHLLTPLRTSGVGKSATLRYDQAHRYNPMSYNPMSHFLSITLRRATHAASGPSAHIYQLELTMPDGTEVFQIVEIVSRDSEQVGVIGRALETFHVDDEVFVYASDDAEENTSLKVRSISLYQKEQPLISGGMAGRIILEGDIDALPTDFRYLHSNS